MLVIFTARWGHRRWRWFDPGLLEGADDGELVLNVGGHGGLGVQAGWRWWAVGWAPAIGGREVKNLILYCIAVFCIALNLATHNAIGSEYHIALICIKYQKAKSNAFHPGQTMKRFLSH